MSATLNYSNNVKKIAIMLIGQETKIIMAMSGLKFGKDNIKKRNV